MMKENDRLQVNGGIPGAQLHYPFQQHLWDASGVKIRSAALSSELQVVW